MILDAVGLILDTGDAFVNSVGTALTRETRELVGGEADQGRDSIHLENIMKIPMKIQFETILIYSYFFIVSL